LLNQNKRVQQLNTEVIYKQEFWNREENVKLYYFKVPDWDGNYRVQINIQSLDDGFYPMLFLTKNERSSAPSDFSRDLSYPSLNSANFGFGLNFFELVNEKMVTSNYS